MLEKPHAGPPVHVPAECQLSAPWQLRCQQWDWATGHVQPGRHLTVSTWEASSQNCSTEPFPSSWCTKSWAKLKDYFKPLSLGVIYYTAIVKRLYMYASEILKLHNLRLFILGVIISLLLFHMLCVWMTDHDVMSWPPSGGWKGNIGGNSASKGWIGSACNETECPDFRGGPHKWAEERQVPRSCGLKGNYL